MPQKRLWSKHKKGGKPSFSAFGSSTVSRRKGKYVVNMSFPLTPGSLSIGTSNDILLKTDKAKWMRYSLKI